MSKFSTVQKILLTCCAVILAFILLTTVLALSSGKYSPGSNVRKSDVSPEELETSDRTGQTKVFTELGVIRTGTRDEPSVPIIITPFFSYPADDIEYREELYRRTTQIQQIMKSYFSEFTKEELMKMGEQKVKQDLLELINDELVLGKIPALYFEQYKFFD